MKALILLAILLPGCVGLGARESSFEYSDGRKVTVICQSDGRCQHGDVIVDNRGPLGQVWATGAAVLNGAYATAKGVRSERGIPAEPNHHEQR